MTRLESALRTLADDPLTEPAPANLADQALARARQRSRRQRVLPVVATAVAVACLAAGITIGQQRWQSAATAPAAKGAATEAAAVFSPARQTVLLIGSDAAEDRIGVRPDTIMLAEIDTRTGSTALISLPRNLQNVPFRAGTPGAKAWPKGFDCGDECLLNSVWFWAEQSDEYRGVRHPGLTATTQAVEGITGVTVDETVVVNMKGLVDLVDAVGGVDVNVRRRLPIGGTPNDRQATGWIEKGEQHLTGRQALWFARSRWSTSDSDRMGRQQCLITAVAQQVDARTLLTAYPKIAKALGDNLSTSIAAADLAKWAEVATRMRSAKISPFLVTGNSTDPDFAQIRRAVAAIGSSSSTQPSSSAAPEPANGQNSATAC